jgi:hypothetical protein
MYKVNPQECTYTTSDAGYCECHLEFENDYDIAQDIDLLNIFSIDNDMTLDSLVRYKYDVTLLVKRKQEHKRIK